MIEDVKKEFKKYASKKRADHSARFFKTGKGEYAEADLFLGVRNPDIYKVVNKFKKEMSIDEAICFLQHEIHEYRLFGLKALEYKYKEGDKEVKKEIVDIYLDNIKYINNWDLVDLSAPNILGDYLLDNDRNILYVLVNKEDLWSKRIAILSTFAFIKNDEFGDALKISKILLTHEHDLIHKAVGWMLREIWKRDSEIAEKFIKDNYDDMDRMTLRYAIEKMDEGVRMLFLKKIF
ncbi:MAG: DNA alkylation repair protein [Candidatus Dojkabacteria bacterium]|nr:DNA alkylation repair protein [Candidatus Dojkabacteria bacterium]